MAARGAGARRRARGGDQHRLARGQFPARARRRLALRPGHPYSMEGATTAARSRPPAPSQGAAARDGGRRTVLGRLGRYLRAGLRFEAVAVRRFAAGGALAQLWLVPNPPHHAQGDFGIAGGLAVREACVTWPRSACSGRARTELMRDLAPGQGRRCGPVSRRPSTAARSAQLVARRVDRCRHPERLAEADRTGGTARGAAPGLKGAAPGEARLLRQTPFT